MTLTDEEIRVKKQEDDKINRRVAEVLGLHPYLGVVFDGCRCGTCGELIHEGQHYVIRPADYLNDEREARKLCDRMHSEGWSVSMERSPAVSDRWLVTVTKEGHPDILKINTSLARAVALCFLAAHSNEN